MADDQPLNPPPDPPRFTERVMALLPQLGAWITVGLIGILAVGIIWVLVKGVVGQNPIVRDLADIDYARGLITFIFTVGTVGIALLLTIGALVGNHPEAQFAKAKEVLTALIGIFGTILGFYFGTSSASSGVDRSPLVISPPSIQVTADSKSTTVRAYVSGGELPYVYAMDFPADELDVKAKISKDGWIVEAIDTSRLSPPPIGYKIVVTDNKKQVAEYEAKENERIGPKVAAAPQ